MSLPLSGTAIPGSRANAGQGVVARPPALRRSAVGEGVDEPLQVVHRRLAVPTVHLDWRGLSDVDGEAELERLLAEDRAAGMALTEAPLLRLVIAALPDAEILLT